VEDAALYPSNTSYAGGNLDNLTVNYAPSNSGQADTVTAEVTNYHHEAFEHGLLKFIMPNKHYGFTVENGTLEQSVVTDTAITCYIAVNIPAYNALNVVVKLDTTLAIEAGGSIPGFSLKQNYPNPFNPATRIEYSLSESSKVVLTIFDIRGREVRQLVNSHFGPGDFAIHWDGRTMNGTLAPAGIYFARLATRNDTDYIKMLLLR
jgi:hypothetical protein